jgi:PAS domain S-box-containing protein
MAQGSWDWDLASGKMSMSSDLERVLGLPAGTFGGSLLDFMATVHVEDVDLVAGAITSALKDRHSLDVEYRAVTADGSALWLRLSGRVACDPHSRPVGILGEAIDVTYLHAHDNLTLLRRRPC